MAKHKDNYVQAKMQEQINKSLHCFKEILRIMEESEKYLETNENCKTEQDKLYYRGHTYNKLVETLDLYYPRKKVGDEGDSISE